MNYLFILPIFLLINMKYLSVEPIKASDIVYMLLYIIRIAGTIAPNNLVPFRIFVKLQITISIDLINHSNHYNSLKVSHF